MLGGKLARGACTCGDMSLEQSAAALEVDDNTDFLRALSCDPTAKDIFELQADPS